MRYTCLVFTVLAAAQEGRWEETMQRAARLRDEAHFNEAETAYRQALEIAGRESGQGVRVARTLNNFGMLYAGQRRFGEAQPLLRRAVAAWGADAEAAIGHTNLGSVLYSLGFKEESEAAYRCALAIRDVPGNDETLLVNSLNNLSEVLRGRGKIEESEALLRRAVRVQPASAASLNNLGQTLAIQGKHAEAEAMLKRALEIWEETRGPKSPLTAAALNNLGSLCRDLQRYSEAEAYYRRSLVIRERVLGVEDPAYAQALSNLAVLYADLGRYGEAEAMLREAAAITEKALGPDHREYALRLNNLGDLLLERGRFAGAEAYYRRALSVQKGAAARATAEKLVVALRAQGRNQEAKRLSRSSFAAE